MVQGLRFRVEAFGYRGLSFWDLGFGFVSLVWEEP